MADSIKEHWEILKIIFEKYATVKCSGEWAASSHYTHLCLLVSHLLASPTKGKSLRDSHFPPAILDSYPANTRMSMQDFRRFCMESGLTATPKKPMSHYIFSDAKRCFLHSRLFISDEMQHINLSSTLSFMDFVSSLLSVPLWIVFVVKIAFVMIHLFSYVKDRSICTNC